jgi:uncharacterized protein (DUF983 family)
MFPIFLIQPSTEPEACPACHKEEDTALVCRHCGHEYETEDEGGWPVWLTLTVITFIILFALHFCIWALASANGDTQMTYWQAILKTVRYIWERIITRIF